MRFAADDRHHDPFGVGTLGGSGFTVAPPPARRAATDPDQRASPDQMQVRATPAIPIANTAIKAGGKPSQIGNVQ